VNGYRADVKSRYSWCTYAAIVQFDDLLVDMQ